MHTSITTMPSKRWASCAKNCTMDHEGSMTTRRRSSVAFTGQAAQRTLAIPRGPWGILLTKSLLHPDTGDLE